jgi:V8-like Glu-specific endopeptidase
MPQILKHSLKKRTKNCSAIIVHKDSILDTYDQAFKQLKSIPFGEKYKLTINTSHYNLPSVTDSYASCFAIGPIKNENDIPLIVTAKHVIDHCLLQTMSTDFQSLFSKIRIVFGYDNDYNNQSIKTNEIYEIEDIYNDTYNNNENDFVLLKLKDNTIDERLYGEVQFERKPNKTKIYSFGYPYGMPLYKSYGEIINNDSKTKKGYYITNLTAFNGNSGAPVFDQSNKIIGILFGGGQDFEYTKKTEDEKVNTIRYLKTIKFSRYVEEKENGIFVLPIDVIKNKLKNIL